MSKDRYQNIRHNDRNLSIVKMYEEGLLLRLIAIRHGLSISRVQEILKGLRCQPRYLKNQQLRLPLDYSKEMSPSLNVLKLTTNSKFVN